MGTNMNRVQYKIIYFLKSLRNHLGESFSFPLYLSFHPFSIHLPDFLCEISIVNLSSVNFGDDIQSIEICSLDDSKSGHIGSCMRLQRLLMIYHGKKARNMKEYLSFL